MTRSNDTAVVGVGHSKVYRNDEVSLGLLAIDACTEAIDDAGLMPTDIDGVVVSPSQPFDMTNVVDGRSIVSPEYMINALGLDVCWFEAAGGSMAHTFIEGVNAVASGNCKAVLVYRALHNPKGRYGQTDPSVAGGVTEFSAPFGVFAPGMYAHLWTRYIHEYGTTREQMAPFIVNNRKNALLWEHGYWYQHKPDLLTENDYLEGRMISEPLSLYDCDIPVQGAGAFVITTGERARHLRHKPAYVRGWAIPGGVGGSRIATLDVLRERTEVFGRHLFENAGIAPTDVNVANVYDGFSIFVPLWLETLGFCKKGEAFDFMVPERIGIDGELPINTSSGNLGAGRMHGVPHLMESVLQIQGRSGPRQVANAEIALATAGGIPAGTAGVIFGSEPNEGRR